MCIYMQLFIYAIKIDKVNKGKVKNEQRLLHTPDGVMDIYNGQCERKEELLGRLHRQLKLHAFKDIQTPVYEYFDVFNGIIWTFHQRKCINLLTEMEIRLY